MKDIFLHCIHLTPTPLLIFFPRVGSTHTTSAAFQEGASMIKTISSNPLYFIRNSLFASMAALPVNSSFYYKNSLVQEVKRSMSRNCHRFLVVLSCQNDEPIEKSTSTTKKEDRETRQSFSQLFAGVQKFGRGLKQSMSPQQKGDWKDVMLMSLSFAVYVYMSQKIVCAYFAWMSLPKQSW